MNSDTESLAFMEEDDVSPTPKNTPPAEVPRPRIVASPNLSQPKSTSAKPPLHRAVAPAPTPAATKAPALGRGGLGQLAAGKARTSRQDTASELSDNESINFFIDNNSMSGASMRGTGLSAAAAAAAAAAGRRNSASKRLSRVASNSSIQFHSEPGSRSNSPKPTPRPTVQGSTPVEKAVAPPTPPPSGKAPLTNDSISFFFEQSDGSDHAGNTSPSPKSVTVRGHAASPPVPPAKAAPAAPMTSGSVSGYDSITFQVDESSGDGRGQATSSLPAPPLGRTTSTGLNASFSAKSYLHPAAAFSPVSAADTSHNELADSSIAFEIVDDPPAAKARLARPSLQQQHKKTTVTPSTTSPPKQQPAAPFNNSHVRRSQSAQSRRNSQLSSPSIQFESDHNSDDESVLFYSASQVGGSSPPVGSAALPDTDQPQTCSPTLPMPEVLDASLTNVYTETGGNNVAGPAASSTKKTVVTNHLQQRRRQQQQRQSRLLSPQPRPNARTAANGGLSPTPSTHPPLYQKTDVATPIAAQAVGAAVTAAASDRNLPRKKDPSAVLNLQQPGQTRRSKESATTESQGASPNVKLLTEAGSTTGTTDSPPEPPHTGRHSRSSTQDHVSSRRAHSSTTSVQGYLANQEMENAYHRHEATQRARQDGSRTSRVLYREVSPSLPLTDDPAAATTVQEAEQWRRFNEQQRAELMELRRRIALARRQDLTLLEGSPMRGLGAASGPVSRRGNAPQHTALALASLPGWTNSGSGYSNMKQRPSTRATSLQDQQRNMPMKSASAHLLSPAESLGNSRKASPQSCPQSARERAAPTQPHASGGFLYDRQMRKLLASCSPSRPSQPYSAAPQKKSAWSRRTPVSPPYRAAAPSAAAAAGQPPGTSNQDLIRSPAAAAVADMLGVLWPPRKAGVASAQANRTLPFSDSALSIDLYFVNGSRLTAAQVDRFFDLVRVQAEAEQTKKVNRDLLLSSADLTLSPQSYRDFSPTSALLRNCSIHDDPLVLGARDGLSGAAASPSPSAKRQRAPLSAKLSALLPKKAVRRSRVMRAVFDAMDLKHQGSLVTDLLPSLTRLFEDELAALEQARLSLLHGHATPLATLLESAMASRRQYASTWNSGSHGGAGGGLQQVLSADGAGLIPDAQTELLSLTHRLLLLSFAVNVVIPIASASRIPLLDFPTLCMVVFAAVDNVEHEMDSPREQWGEVVQQYFILLDS